MYSDNDFRSYSELRHGWGWKPAQKAREKEYNAWYYATHPEKWGVGQAVNKAVNAGLERLDELSDKTKTNLDDRLVEGAQSAYSKLKSGIKNTAESIGNKHMSTAAMRLEQARRNYESNRTAANRKALSNAQKEYNKTARSRVERAVDSTANRAARGINNAAVGVGRVANNVGRAAGKAASDVKTNVGNAVDSAKKTVNRKINQSPTMADNFARDAVNAVKRGDLNNAKNFAGQTLKEVGKDIGRTATNVKTNVGNAVSNAKTTVGKAIRTGVKNSPTQVDNLLLSAYDNAKSGNKSVAKALTKSAGKVAAGEIKSVPGKIGSAVSGAGRNVKDAVNRAIDKTPTKADDEVREAYRSLRSGNTTDAKNHLTNAGGVAKNNLINQGKVVGATLQNQAGVVGNKATNLKNTLQRVAEDAWGASTGAASSAVGAVSGQITNLQKLVEKYGWDSNKVKDAYGDILSDISDALSANNKKNSK